jgi:RNA polymerase sigma factor (sigma-70 family)
MVFQPAVAESKSRLRGRVSPTRPGSPHRNIGISAKESPLARIPLPQELRSTLRASMPTPPGEPTPREMFEENYPLIERILAHTCRRSSLGQEDSKDFAGFVRLKLIDDNYAVLRQFRGTSKLGTFLAVAIKRLLLDYRDHLWGKWRLSAEAQRLGPVAERLETLLVRDEYTFDEAFQILRQEGVELSELEVAALRRKLPPRIVRKMVPDEALQSEPSRELRPDEVLEQKERDAIRRRLAGLLRQALEALSKEDKVLVLLRMDFKVSDIARLRGLDQKRLYRRIDKAHEKLRRELARLGVRRADIESLIGRIKPGLLDF